MDDSSSSSRPGRNPPVLVVVEKDLTPRTSAGGVHLREEPEDFIHSLNRLRTVHRPPLMWCLSIALEGVSHLSDSSRRPCLEGIQASPKGRFTGLLGLGENGYCVGSSYRTRILGVTSERVGRPIDPDQQAVRVRGLVGEPVERIAEPRQVRICSCVRR